MALLTPCKSSTDQTPITLVASMVCSRLKDVQTKLAEEGKCPTLALAVTEVVNIAMAIMMLTGQADPVVSGLDKVLSATKGSKHQVRVVLTSSEYWRGVEKQMRKRCVATATFGPEMADAAKRVPASSLQELCKIAKRMGIWQETLGEASSYGFPTTSIITSLQITCMIQAQWIIPAFAQLGEFRCPLNTCSGQTAPESRPPLWHCLVPTTLVNDLSSLDKETGTKASTISRTSQGKCATLRISIGERCKEIVKGMMGADSEHKTHWEDATKYVGFMNQDMGGSLEQLLAEMSTAKEQHEKKHALGELSASIACVASVAQQIEKEAEGEDRAAFSLPVSELTAFVKHWAAARNYFVKGEMESEDKAFEELRSAETDLLTCVFAYLRQGEHMPVVDGAGKVLPSVASTLQEMAQVTLPKE
eukprot:203363-Amphidinium_carterae.4